MAASTDSDIVIRAFGVPIPNIKDNDFREKKNLYKAKYLISEALDNIRKNPDLMKKYIIEEDASKRVFSDNPGFKLYLKKKIVK